jgi:hypothetical protein
MSARLKPVHDTLASTYFSWMTKWTTWISEQPDKDPPPSQESKRNKGSFVREPFIYRESMLVWMLLGALVLCLIVLGPIYFLIFLCLLVYWLRDMLS